MPFDHRSPHIFVRTYSCMTVRGRLRQRLECTHVRAIQPIARVCCEFSFGLTAISHGGQTLHGVKYLGLLRVCSVQERRLFAAPIERDLRARHVARTRSRKETAGSSKLL